MKDSEVIGVCKHINSIGQDMVVSVCTSDEVKLLSTESNKIMS